MKWLLLAGILLGATTQLARADVTGKLNHFPAEYQGKWCGLKDDWLRYVRNGGDCDNPAAVINITSRVYRERGRHLYARHRSGSRHRIFRWAVQLRRGQGNG
jgi:hypothetical protein